QLYPQAKVLVTQREDLQASRRRQFVGRCATGDWDAVIMSRSAFERIPMSADAQSEYLGAEVDRMKDFIQASKESDGMSVKRLQGALLRAEERIKKKLESAGISDFDTWAATFGETIDQIEMAPEGGNSFRQKTRFARFTNVPEML